MLSCDFEHRGCSQSTLFLNEYKRTNRTKGTKILRCFPHCCPEHVNRSYCGSALHVQVRAQAATKRQRSQMASPVLRIDDLYVFAHFEEVGANTLALDDELPAAAVFNSLQTEQTPKGEWIQGQPYETIDEAAHLFQINPSARWYYEWESAATKAQRFTKHVLKVYVLQALASPTDSTVTSLRVVAVTSSSEFMVVSYRRAPSDLRGDSSRILAMLTENVIQQRGELGLERDSIMASLGQKVLPLLVEKKMKEDREAKGSPTSSWSPQSSDHTPLLSRRDRAVADRRLWEAHHNSTLKMAKRIAVLYHFLTATPAADFRHLLSSWVELFASFTQRRYSSPLRVNSTPPPSTMRAAWSFLSPLKSMSPGSQTLPSVVDQFGASNSDVSMLVQKCAQVVSWLVFDRTNKRVLEQFLIEATRGLLDKSVLQDVYLRGVSKIHDLVDGYTTKHFGTSFAQLHEDIVAVFFRVDEFQPLRAQLLEMLSSTTMAGFELLVSQARLGYIQRNAVIKRKRDIFADELYASPPRPSSPMAHFAGAWSFDGQQCVVSRLNSAPSSSLSMTGALEWMREFAGVSVSVDAEGTTLTIRSQWSLPSSEGMQLILDGKKRVFSSFPSGVSSAVPWNGLACGDYRAQPLSLDCIMLEFTGWPAATDSAMDSRQSSHHTTAQRMKLCLRLTPSHMSHRVTLLAMDSVVEHGRCLLTQEDPVTQTVESRRQLVASWTPMYQIKAVYSPLSSTC